MIEVKNLVKDYGGHVAVDHLDFTVEDGYIYGFLGPNGAGKSTTMNMMTGYLGATSGEIIINGHNILDEPEEAKKNIGYLPEIPPLYTEMTVIEYLDFAAQLKKIPKKKRKDEIERAIEVTKLRDVQNRLIRNLSKGYKQRVGLAQAILGTPPVIILDEPTVGLDPKQIIEIRDLIKELGKQHTVILSSHILSEVRAVCDRVLILAHGKLVASDTPDNLERQLTGGHGLELTVKGEEERIRQTLEALECAKYLNCVQMTEGTVEGEWKLSLEIMKEEEYGKDIRECVFYGFAEARCPIVSMTEQKKSLEEVFLELTESEAKDPVVSEIDQEEKAELKETEITEMKEKGWQEEEENNQEEEIDQAEQSDTKNGEEDNDSNI